MGDRISIQFENEKEKSVVLFNHWDGKTFLSEARKYAEELKKWAEQNKKEEVGTPLNRLEPQTVIVDFIRWYCEKEGIKRVENNLYLGKNKNEGDNSDNGHFIIKLT